MANRAKFLIADVVEIAQRGIAILGTITEGTICPGMRIVQQSSAQPLPAAMVAAVESVRCISRTDINVGLMLRFLSTTDRQAWKNETRTGLTVEIHETHEINDQFMIS